MSFIVDKSSPKHVLFRVSIFGHSDVLYGNWFRRYYLGVPWEVHPLRVGRCASDLWLWARWALRVVQRSVVTLRVAQWSEVALRHGWLFFMQLVVSSLGVVFKMRFSTKHADYVP